jgi:hypothetical protein
VTKLPVEAKTKINFSAYALFLVTIVIHAVAGLKLRQAKRFAASQASDEQSST